MYNGIGLQTARGSGTNGYVGRNLSLVNKLKKKVEYRTEDDIKRLEASLNRPPNEEILAHQRKRQIELKCLEMKEKMEDLDYSEEEINAKLATYREELQQKAESAIQRKKEFMMELDQNGRPLVKETHQIAELNQERNEKLKNALGISPNFVEGSSLASDRRTKQDANVKNPEEQSKEKTVVHETDNQHESNKEKIKNKLSIETKIDNKKYKEKESRKKHSYSSSSSSTSSISPSRKDRNRSREMLTKETNKYRRNEDDENRTRRRKRSKSRSVDRYRSKKRSHESRNTERRTSRERRDSREKMKYDRDRKSKKIVNKESHSYRKSRSRSKSNDRRRRRSRRSPSSSSSNSSSSSSSKSSHSNVSRSSRSRSKSPPIRMRKGSPSFMMKRRITS